MKRKTLAQFQQLLNACHYDELLVQTAAYSDADATYFRALALDQLAAFRKSHGETYKVFLKRSRKNINDGLQRFPHDTRFQFLEGLHFLHAQKPADALLCFTQLYKKTHDLRILVSIGNAFKALGEYSLALKKYRQGVRGGLSTLMMAHNIAITYVLMERYDLAKKVILKGLAQKPKNAFERVIILELKQLFLKFS